jgi:hypothetical protein
MLGPTVLTRHSRSASLEPGAYLTDDTRLYYVVLVSPGAESESFVTVEDCGTLEMFVCPLRDLERRRLRLVRASDEG